MTTSRPDDFIDWHNINSDVIDTQPTAPNSGNSKKLMLDGGVTLSEVSRSRQKEVNSDQNSNQYQTTTPVCSPAKTTWHTRDKNLPPHKRQLFNRLHRLQHGRGHTYEGFHGQRVHPQRSDMYIRCDAILQYCEISKPSRKWALRKVMTEDLRGFSKYYEGADGAAIGFALLNQYDTPEIARDSYVTVPAKSILSCDLDKLIAYVFRKWS